MLIMFGLLYAVINVRTDKDALPNLNQVTANNLDAAQIKSFISDCLDATAREAIELVAYQGGYIYDYQIEDGM